MLVIPGHARLDFRKYRKCPYVRVLLVVVAVHVLMFVLTPPFQFEPYAVAAQDTIVAVDIPVFVIPPPPEDVPEPPVKVDPIINGGEDVELPETSPPKHSRIPPPVPVKPGRPSAFAAFEKAPEVRHLAKPVYPDLARQAGIEGIVQILVTIGVDGKVVDARVAASDVTRAMDRAALEAAWKCEFRPAEQAGKKVQVTVMLPFEFRLTSAR